MGESRAILRCGRVMPSSHERGVEYTPANGSQHGPRGHVHSVLCAPTKLLLRSLQIVSVVSSGERFLDLPVQNLCEVHQIAVPHEGGANRPLAVLNELKFSFLGMKVVKTKIITNVRGHICRTIGPAYTRNTLICKFRIFGVSDLWREAKQQR